MCSRQQFTQIRDAITVGVFIDDVAESIAEGNLTPRAVGILSEQPQLLAKRVV